MKPASQRGRRTRGQPLGALFAFGLLALLLSACGIGFGSASEETEVFKSLRLEGDLRAGALLTLVLDYAQQYPVNLVVVCDLLSPDPVATATPDPEAPTPSRLSGTPTLVRIPKVQPTPTNRVLKILGRTLEPNPEGGPLGEATPVLGTIKHRFFAPDVPGRYKVRCYTPADENNAISQQVTFGPRPTPTPR